MPINSTLSAEGLMIVVTERFDFSLHQEFRESYRHALEPGTKFWLDLKGADYMDSSALGMILLLKDHADTLGGELIIWKPNEEIRRILDIAKFERFVSIEA